VQITASGGVGATSEKSQLKGRGRWKEGGGKLELRGNPWS